MAEHFLSRMIKDEPPDEQYKQRYEIFDESKYPLTVSVF